MPLDQQTQAKIDALLSQARMVYESIVEAQPVAELARSIRDKKPFEKLTDAELEGCCLVVKGLEKRMEAAAKLYEAAQPAAATAGGPAAPTELPTKPAAAAAPASSPAARKRGSGRGPGNGTAPTPAAVPPAADKT